MRSLISPFQWLLVYGIGMLTYIGLLLATLPLWRPFTNPRRWRACLWVYGAAATVAAACTVWAMLVQMPVVAVLWFAMAVAAVWHPARHERQRRAQMSRKEGTSIP